MEKSVKKALPEPHKFIIALQEQRSKSKLIRGFIGKSEKEDNVRVYLDVELKRYVESFK